jgi:hypothetical protein
VHNKRLHLRFAQSQAAAMASSMTIPPATPDPFDLGIHTPANLNRGARAALLQNSPAAVNGPVGVSPGPGRMAQTPSSPLIAATTAAATEGAERTSPSLTLKQQPVSIIESANGLARERVEEYNDKLTVFQALKPLNNSPANHNDVSLNDLPTASSTPGNESSQHRTYRPKADIQQRGRCRALCCP